MWFSFFVCLLVGAIILYAPGSFLFKALGFNTPTSITFAPLVAVATLGIAPMVFKPLGIPSNAFTLVAAIALVCLLPFAARLLFRRKRTEDHASRFDWTIVAVYALFGLAVCFYVFVKPLDGADSFYCRADNATHLNMVRYFTTITDWSSVSASTGSLALLDSSYGFYPAAWHSLAALTSLIAHADPIVAINSTNTLVCGLIFPLSVLALLKALFPAPENKPVLLIGALASMAFAAFPWTFLIKGPLVSNLLAYALLPGALGLLVHYVENGPLKHWAGLVSAFLISFAALALSQPNALFCAIVFAAPYLVDKTARKLHGKKGAVGGLLVAAAFIALWAIALNLPFLQNTVQFPNAGGLNLSVLGAIEASVTFVFYAGQPAQILLAALCLVGAVLAIKRKMGWILFPALYMLVAYAVSRCTEEPIRNILCGFWYNDPWRLSDCAAIFLIPLAALGMAATLSALVRFIKWERSSNGHTTTKTLERALSCLLVICFACYNFFPSYRDPLLEKRQATPFGFVRDRLAKEYSTKKDQIYSPAERAFVEKALKVIPEDSLVINVPEDGSLFAYGANDLNTYYRHPTVGGLTDQANIIRTDLVNIASDPRVKQAVEDTGAQYVLLLDQGVPFEEGKWLLQTSEGTLSRWNGINDITDETSGFEVVLKDGDMRLYKITAVDDTEKNEG
ncbi:MAG: hypothetical protein HFJ66_01365 [Eggerthellaceae bacterium]|nr:hypothetical protein [Eggerthellaceae bacterium]